MKIQPSDAVFKTQEEWDRAIAEVKLAATRAKTALNCEGVYVLAMFRSGDIGQAIDGAVGDFGGPLPQLLRTNADVRDGKITGDVLLGKSGKSN